jgi:chromosome partitioning protein
MTGQRPLTDVVVHRSDSLDVVPSHIDLAGAEVELVSKLARERILRDALADSASAYDCVLIDCPPSLGLMTLNALVASDEILLTLQPHVLALQGMSKLLETAQLVRQRLNPRLRISGLVFCMFDGRTTLSSEVLADVEGFFARAAGHDALLDGVRVFHTRIRRNIKLAEAPGFGQTIFEYEPSSHGAEDYRRLAGELLGSAPPEESTEDAEPILAAEEEPQADRPPDEPAPEPETASAEPGPPPGESADAADAPAPERGEADAPCSPAEETPHEPRLA